MRLGIFAKTFARPTVEEVFGAVAGHGLGCVQFNFASAGLPSLPERLEPEVVERIGRAAAGRGIALAAVSGTFNMIHPDRQARQEGLRRLQVIAQACPRLGAGIVTLCTGTRDPKDQWRVHPDNDSAEAWRDLVAIMTEAIGLAEQFQLTLAFEPEPGNVVSSARRARRLLDELKSPRLKVIVDAANLLLPDKLQRQRETLEEALGLLGGDIVLAHAKEVDAAGHVDHLALGQGVLDWELYLKLLGRANFTGPLIMHGFDEEGARASVAFLRAKLPATRSGQKQHV